MLVALAPVSTGLFNKLGINVYPLFPPRDGCRRDTTLKTWKHLEMSFFLSLIFSPPWKPGILRLWAFCNHLNMRIYFNSLADLALHGSSSCLLEMMARAIHQNSLHPSVYNASTCAPYKHALCRSYGKRWDSMLSRGRCMCYSTRSKVAMEILSHYCTASVYRVIYVCILLKVLNVAWGGVG